MDRRRTAAAVVSAVLLLTLTGCAGGSSPPHRDDTTTSPAPVGESAGDTEELRFTARTLTGEKFDGTSLAGRDAVLWFWAPWCPQCRAEAPHVAAAQTEAGDAVTFVGVAALAPIDDMRAFVRDYKVSAFDHIADMDRSVWTRFGVQAQPAYAFIDDSGEISVARGVLGADEIADRVAALTAH